MGRVNILPAGGGLCVSASKLIARRVFMKWEIITLVLGALVLWKAGYIRRELTSLTAPLPDRYEKIANSLGVLLLVIIFLVTVYSAKVVVSPIYCMVMGEDVSCIACDPHEWPCDIPLP